MALPKVRWGTLRMPFASREQTRKWLEGFSEANTGIVAVLDGRLVGQADVIPYKGRRSHAGGIGVCVHDDFHGRGIGSALLAALIDAADNWLNLRRLELTVYVDNEPAIGLYKKFGFAIEGTRRGDAFRDGAYVDSYAMARSGVLNGPRPLRLDGASLRAIGAACCAASGTCAKLGDRRHISSSPRSRSSARRSRLVGRPAPGSRTAGAGAAAGSGIRSGAGVRSS